MKKWIGTAAKTASDPERPSINVARRSGALCAGRR